MTRFVFLSDTHSNGPRMGKLPDGDVLIHAGDHTVDGGFWECSEALAWFGSHPHKIKLLIPGNHDMLSARDPESWNDLCRRDDLFDLTKSPLVSLSFGSFEPSCWVWGSPVSPASERAKSISTKWGAHQYLRSAGYPWKDWMPEGLDLALSHGPPEGIGDLSYGVRFGCPDLRDAINQRKPKLHVFGHNHEQPGQWHYDDTQYANVSTNHGNVPATVYDFNNGQWTFVSGPNYPRSSI